jgi:hypothetical protein
MAALVKAINARIRSNPYLDYFCSTHFWGPASNFGIPLAAIADAKKSPELISGNMTGALVVYSAVFMRYSLAVTPKNYLLFGCHFINECSQLSQGYRFLNYHYWGGKEKMAADRAKEIAGDAIKAAGTKAEELKSSAKAAIDEIKK